MDGGQLPRDRALLYGMQEEQWQMAVTAGVTQGLVLGPDLWNAPYDSLLKMEMLDKLCLVGYANNVMVQKIYTIVLLVNCCFVN